MAPGANWNSRAIFSKALPLGNHRETRQIPVLILRKRTAKHRPNLLELRRDAPRLRLTRVTREQKVPRTGTQTSGCSAAARFAHSMALHDVVVGRSATAESSIIVETSFFVVSIRGSSEVTKVDVALLTSEEFDPFSLGLCNPVTSTVTSQMPGARFSKR
jgi:hypothetical protein